MDKLYLRHRLNVHERVLRDVAIPSRASQQLDARYAPDHKCACANQFALFAAYLAVTITETTTIIIYRHQEGHVTVGVSLTVS